MPDGREDREHREHEERERERMRELDREHREQREHQDQLAKAVANAAAVAAALQGRPVGSWSPEQHDRPPPYREHFEGHTDDRVTALQFSIHVLEQRVASLEAIVAVQSVMLKSMSK